MTDNGRVDQRFYAPIGRRGELGAWKVVILTKEGGKSEQVEQRVIVAADLQAIVGVYKGRVVEATFLGVGECIINVDVEGQAAIEATSE